MVNDPIVNEIHQFREQLLAQHQGDFAAYFAALLSMQKRHPEQYAFFCTVCAVCAGARQPIERTT